MSEKNTSHQELTTHDEGWERRVEAMSKQIDFPPTPDIAGLVAQRLHKPHKRSIRYALVPATILLSILFILILTVPDIRVIASDVLRIGGIQLVREERPRESVSLDTPNDYVEALRDIAEEVNLDVLQPELNMTVPLPTFPDELGPPDKVFLRRDEPMMIILVWNDPDDAASIEFSLQLLPNTVDIRKYYDADPTIVIVRRTYGFWLTEPHLFTLRLSNGTDFFERWIEQDVLIWEENDITFRIESDLPIETVEQIAESLTYTP